LLDLMAVAHDSPLYNEGSKRSIFYAESWALMHYAILGRPERQGQILKLVELLTNGTPLDRAFVAAFGFEPSQLERELQEYVQRQTYQYAVATFDDSVVKKIPQAASRLPEPEATARLGDLLARMNQPDEATALLNKALAASPDLAFAHAALGMLQERQGKSEEALVHLKRAAALKSNNELAYFYY